MVRMSDRAFYRVLLQKFVIEILQNIFVLFYRTSPKQILQTFYRICIDIFYRMILSDIRTIFYRVTLLTHILQNLFFIQFSIGCFYRHVLSTFYRPQSIEVFYRQFLCNFLKFYSNCLNNTAIAAVYKMSIEHVYRNIPQKNILKIMRIETFVIIILYNYIYSIESYSIMTRLLNRQQNQQLKKNMSIEYYVLNTVW